ncbi:cyclic 3',5'-adenosine monophosphate phosphodiesterase [Halomonas sp. THAF5a]|uniref:metallophosphoesterase n=1 Tax=Halomonas sp. THAF5a TaxID=2587844 RepID=UPI001267CF43|nr:metallophosphoesterase [Halomonas sp. THAF5a]QFU02070.1 cyclic 3',5'-adenosine monophosphate phosphodiesterase [Halomonas sp. THAF5a]
MRLRILSDLHLEHFAEGRDLPWVDADAVVLAGDIHIGCRGLAWAAERFAGLPILYVPGNHEYYGGVMPALRDTLADEAERLGIHLLDNRTLTLGGVRFHGLTLWTDFALYAGTPELDVHGCEQAARRVMLDFRRIEQPVGELFTPAESRRLHAESLAWLANELARPWEGPRVVISHHAPLGACIPPCYRGDPLSPAFASDLESLMGRMDLWLHGHVHEPVDLRVKGTRVMANPGGYPNEFNPPRFAPACVVEV